MSEAPIVRETADNDLPRILEIYPQAFPDEELRPTVSELIEGDAEALSLAAVSDQRFVGHVLFTVFSGSGADEGRAGALLGPLAVLPDNQKQGVGSALIGAGIEHLRTLGIRQIFVLGDPNYYGRFGFQQERLLMPPYALPEQWSAAWQSLTIADAKPLSAGKCVLADTWMHEALWTD